MPETLEADFVIVGAGYAGLTAAWRLAHATPPASVIVLEARSRVGGRVRTDMLSDGTWLDLGGTWFGPGQDYSYNLAREMGVCTYPTYNDGDSLLVVDGMPPIRNPEQFPCAGLFPAAASLVLLDELESMSKEVPLHAPWEAKRAREWDRQTFAGWVESQAPEASLATARTALHTIMTGLFSIDTSELSLLDALYLLHSHQGLLRLMSVKGGDQQDRIVGGAQHIANLMKDQLGDAVRLGEAVRKIVQDSAGVTVTASTVTVRAKRAIVTIPPALAGFVEYEPPLPAERAQLQQRVPYGSVVKIVTIYDQPFWRDDHLTGQSFALTDPVAATFDGCTDKDKDTPGVLISFVFGPNATAFSRMSRDDRKRTTVEALVKRFGPAAGKLKPVRGPEGEFDGYHDIQWADELWSRGGIFAHFPTGVLTNYGSLLKKPAGFIHWAGTETSSAFHGSINGAIESGERAANEVLRETRGSGV
jgi:monoamine oxidase